MVGTANYAGIVKWAQLDLQRIQHRDFVGHLSIFTFTKIYLLKYFFTKLVPKDNLFEVTLKLLSQNIPNHSVSQYGHSRLD